MQLTHSIRKSLLVLVLAGLAGCTGSVGGSSGAAGTAGPGSAGTIGTGGAGGGLVVSTCAPGIPVSSQVPRLTRAQYATVINELVGITPGTDVMDLIANDSTGSLTDVSWNGYLTAAEKIATQVLANATSKAKFITCDAAQATCLTDTIKAFGRKAFRRPVTDAEVTSFMRFNTLPQTHTSADVAEAILEAFLASPTFIMVPELAETPEGSAFKLNQYEVAAKLSLLLWNGLPDAELTAAADGNQLGSADQVAMQAKRMLADPKAAGVATTLPPHICRRPDRLALGQRQRSRHHQVPELQARLLQRRDAGARRLLRRDGESRGHLQGSLPSTTAFVTQDTAGIYGLNAASYGATPTKIALDATKRPGFLTRVAFLSTFSHFDATSPILRGAFITGRVLAVPTGAPESGVPGHEAAPCRLQDEPRSHRGAHGPGDLRRVPCPEGQSAGFCARAVRRRRWLAGHGSARRPHQLDGRTSPSTEPSSRRSRLPPTSWPESRHPRTPNASTPGCGSTSRPAGPPL